MTPQAFCPPGRSLVAWFIGLGCHFLWTRVSHRVWVILLLFFSLISYALYRFPTLSLNRKDQGWWLKNFLQVRRSRPEEVKWVSLDGTPSSGGMTNTEELLEEIDGVLAGGGGSISSLSFRDPESLGVGGVHSLWRFNSNRQYYMGWVYFPSLT